MPPGLLRATDIRNTAHVTVARVAQAQKFLRALRARDTRPMLQNKSTKYDHVLHVGFQWRNKRDINIDENFRLRREAFRRKGLPKQNFHKLVMRADLMEGRLNRGEKSRSTEKYINDVQKKIESGRHVKISIDADGSPDKWYVHTRRKTDTQKAKYKEFKPEHVIDTWAMSGMSNLKGRNRLTFNIISCDGGEELAHRVEQRLRHHGVTGCKVTGYKSRAHANNDGAYRVEGYEPGTMLVRRKKNPKQVVKPNCKGPNSKYKTTRFISESGSR